MTEYLIELVKNLPPEIATLILAMIPITELRASIPIALTVFDLGIPAAFFWSVLGDFIPTFFILWLIGPISAYLMRKSKLMNKFFQWIFDRTRRKTLQKYETYGEIALMMFVAIPLPFTGAWTGALAAFLFGIPKKKSLFFITLGILIAGILVTILSLGGIGIFNNIF